VRFAASGPHIASLRDMDSLQRFVGTWAIEAALPNDPVHPLQGRCTFEWMQGGQLLIQRTDAPAPVPSSLAVIAPATTGKNGYTLHYFDSRGVVRLYDMTFEEDVWRLLRTKQDFSALDFCQRFIGTFEDGGRFIRGAWEKSPDGRNWALDFPLTYRRT
jgi:hypothetical protein